MNRGKEIFKLRVKEVGDKAIKEYKYYGIGYDEIVDAYNELGMVCPIMLKRGRSIIESGWGNGYVRIPKDNKYYGKDYDSIPYDVHGGLTFSEVIESNDSFSWPEGHWIGFDTCHFGDNKDRWSKDSVFKETIELFKQTLK